MENDMNYYGKRKSSSRTELKLMSWVGGLETENSKEK